MTLFRKKIWKKTYLFWKINAQSEILTKISDPILEFLSENGDPRGRHTPDGLGVMYSDGGLYRAYRVLRFMYTGGGLYRAYRVLRFMQK